MRVRPRAGIATMVVVGIVVVVLVIAAGAAYVFLGSKSTTPTTTRSIATTIVRIVPGSGITPTGNVSRTCYGYSPCVVTVVLGVNNTVKWTNEDNATHTVSSLSVTPVFDSGQKGMGPGETFTFTFAYAGTFDYGCHFHPWMVAHVVVRAP